MLHRLACPDAALMFGSMIILHRTLIANRAAIAKRFLSAAASTISYPQPPTPPPRKSSIYTKTGDAGSSSLYNGERRVKMDKTFEALGNQDELNAVLGIAREYCSLSNNGIEPMLMEIQCRLFDIGSAIATPPSSSTQKKEYTKFNDKYVSVLEKWIDEMDAALPPLSNFVIPSGGFSATHLNLARTVCRRTERSVVSLVQAGEVDQQVGVYLNRLSDFLFVAARTAAAREGQTETVWRKGDYN